MAQPSPSSAFPQSTNFYWRPTVRQALCLGTQTQWWMRSNQLHCTVQLRFDCIQEPNYWPHRYSHPLPCNSAVSSHPASGLAYGLALANRINKAEVICQFWASVSRGLVGLFQTSAHHKHKPRLDCWRIRDPMESSVIPAETILS